MELRSRYDCSMIEIGDLVVPNRRSGAVVHRELNAPLEGIQREWLSDQLGVVVDAGYLPLSQRISIKKFLILLDDGKWWVTDIWVEEVQ